MKLNNPKFRLCFVIIIAVVLSLAGCKDFSSPAVSERNKPEVKESDNNTDLKNAEEKSIHIALLYKDIYADASENCCNQTVVSLDVVDKIEDLLKNKGYSVMNSSEKYPSYLENSESFHDFWQSVCENKNASQELITVSANGEMYYTVLYYKGGKKYRTYTVVSFDENNNPKVTSNTLYDINDWELINENEFYYQVVFPPRVPFEDYALVRLAPVDEKMFDLTEKYISPIGYMSNNMFVCEWNSDNFGSLSFNDLFEYFYKIKTNDYFKSDGFEKVNEPYYHTYIPQSLFENTVKPYFDISLKEFRSRSLYDSKKRAYEWVEVYCDNAKIFPSVEPEIVKCSENNDGTFTLTVNVRCNDCKTDRLFTHEVTVEPLSDGAYRYMGNKITYKSEYELPPNFPRLPPQRGETDK